MPSAIRVNMFRWRLTRDAQPRWKKGQPAYSTTGAANTNWIQVDTWGTTRWCKPSAGMWPPISRRKTGTVRARPIQKRRRHVDELVVRRHIGGDLERLQRHPADRAASGALLPDLGMHRAGVDRALGRSRRSRLGGEILLRVGHELGPAPGGAEVEDLLGVLGPVLGRGRIHLHPAHRVSHAGMGMNVACMPVLVPATAIMFSRPPVAHLSPSHLRSAGPSLRILDLEGGASNHWKVKARRR